MWHKIGATFKTLKHVLRRLSAIKVEIYLQNITNFSNSTLSMGVQPNSIISRLENVNPSVTDSLSSIVRERKMKKDCNGYSSLINIQFSFESSSLSVEIFARFWLLSRPLVTFIIIISISYNSD